ncbi:hypothetical protein ARMGADRAFT_1038906 [Armillaria gallica]|uniref:Uncharacterized protein n=1 Tax=Armillaria gallica TaxID=47427 RepID=A0A2H3CS40_ARMGA|nr:hypothetical protein ARMGADRAFT_1038906 [Armillaria gallica]
MGSRRQTFQGCIPKTREHGSAALGFVSAEVLKVIRHYVGPLEVGSEMTILSNGIDVDYEELEDAVVLSIDCECQKQARRDMGGRKVSAQSGRNDDAKGRISSSNMPVPRKRKDREKREAVSVTRHAGAREKATAALSSKKGQYSVMFASPSFGMGIVRTASKSITLEDQFRGASSSVLVCMEGDEKMEREPGSESGVGYRHRKEVVAVVQDEVTARPF